MHWCGMGRGIIVFIGKEWEAVGDEGKRHVPICVGHQATGIPTMADLVKYSELIYNITIWKEQDGVH